MARRGNYAGPEPKKPKRNTKKPVIPGVPAAVPVAVEVIKKKRAKDHSSEDEEPD